MLDLISGFFSIEGFVPHGFCLTWRPDVFWTMAASDAAIALAYFSIPVAVLYFVVRRPDLQFKRVGVLFAAFIIACGSTHLLDVWTLWVPDYALAALAKALTAVISVMTTVLLWRLMPAALAMPSRLEIERKNQELVLAQTALRESEMRHRGLVETQFDMVVCIDEGGRFSFVNETACRVLGAPRAELVGGSWLPFVHADDRAVTLEQIAAALSPPYPRVRVENRILNRDGVRWYAWEGCSVSEGGGARREVQAVGRDITERKRVEDELKDQLAFLRSLIEAIPAIVFYKDAAGRYLGCNSRFEEFFAVTAERIVGRRLEEVATSDENREIYVSSDRTTLESRRLHIYEFTRTRPDGAERHVRGFKAPFFKTDGSLGGLIGIILDITDDIARENELRLARSTAEEASRAKSAFLANMSHEIRTPMSAVLGLVYLLEQTELLPIQKDYVEKVRISAQSLLGILNDILDFSKVEAGRIELVEEPFELYDLMKTLATVAAANARNKDIEVLFHIEPGTPLHFLGDLLRLQQILTNLAGNAIKFTRHGEVVLSVRQAGGDEQTPRLLFEVRDSGIGIAREHLETIFEPFRQGDNSAARRYGGTGLGLAICRRLAELMGGDISVESEAGRGSTFRVSLPLRSQPAPARRPEAAQVPRNLKVLLADDNPTARRVMAAMIGPFGWTLVSASSGTEALAAFDAAVESGEPFDLLLLDWCMPDLGGGGIVRHIRGRLAPEDLPIILVVTAFQYELVRSESDNVLDLGAVLTKPVTPSLLLDAVSVACRKRGLPEVSFEAPSAQTGGKPLDGLSLLVVEDTGINQMSARALLENAGAGVVMAGSGTEALSRLAIDADRFDAVLMDIQMPGMDGYEVTRVMREQLGLTDLPVLAMTANALPSDRERCLAVGMVEHIGKPFDVEQMSAVVARHARRRGGTGGAPDAAGQAPPEFDMKIALARTSGDAALLKGLMAEFVRTYSGLADSFLRDIEAGDLAAIQRKIHDLKGVAGNLGATRLFLAAEALHQAARRDDRERTMIHARDVCRILPIALFSAARLSE